MMNKKSNMMLGIVIILLIVVVVYGLSIVVGVTNNVNSDFNDLIQDDDNFAQASKDLSTTSDTRFPIFWDSAIAVIFFFLWMGCIISGLVFNEHPLFFSVFIIGLVVVLVIAFTLQNDYDNFITDDEYSDMSTEFPKVHWIMENIILVLIVVGASIAIALFANISGVI